MDDTIGGRHDLIQRHRRKLSCGGFGTVLAAPASAITAPRVLLQVGRSTAACEPEHHKVGAHKRHGEGAELTPELTGTNVRMIITWDDAYRFRRTLDVLGAAGDGGCNWHGFTFARGQECLEFGGTKNILYLSR